jgi:hypothetical protein
LTLGSFLIAKIAHIFGQHFFHWVRVGNNFDKNNLGYILGHFSQTDLVTLIVGVVPLQAQFIH